MFIFFHETNTKMRVQHSVSLKKDGGSVCKRNLYCLEKGMTLIGELGFPENSIDSLSLFRSVGRVIF